MEEFNNINLRMMIYASLFTALTIVGAYISIPIPFSPVPIVMSDFFIILGGLSLGKKWATASTFLYLLLGILGLPVYAGGSGGMQHIYGPTGGYLIGFLIAAFCIGLISERKKQTIIKDIFAWLVGVGLIFSLGVLWLAFIAKISLNEALVLGFIPFIPGTIIKGIVAISFVQVLRPMVTKSLLR